MATMDVEMGSDKKVEELVDKHLLRDGYIPGEEPPGMRKEIRAKYIMHRRLVLQYKLNDIEAWVSMGERKKRLEANTASEPICPLLCFVCSGIMVTYGILRFLLG